MRSVYGPTTDASCVISTTVELVASDGVSGGNACLDSCDGKLTAGQINDLWNVSADAITALLEAEKMQN